MTAAAHGGLLAPRAWQWVRGMPGERGLAGDRVAGPLPFAVTAGQPLALWPVTAIAGITDGATVWLGGDSAGVAGSALHVRADAKVFITGPYVIGFTTSFRMGQLLRYTFTPPPPVAATDLHAHMCTSFTDALRDCLKTGGWASKDKDQESGGNFLVGVRGRLFEIMSDYQVAEEAIPYMATGAGEAYVLGALHATEGLGMEPGLRLRAALAAAEYHCTDVCGPFRVVRTPPAEAGEAAA